MLPLRLFVLGLVVAAVLPRQACAQKVYWADSDTNKIQRSNLDGTNIETIVTVGAGFPTGLTFDEGARKLYWSDGGTKTIRRCDPDGSNPEILVTEAMVGNFHPSRISLAPEIGKMYWINVWTGRIQRSNMDGSAIEDVIIAPSLMDLTIDLTNGRIYWSALLEGIWSANFDGSAIVQVASYGEYLALDVAAGKVYWGFSSIYRSNLDGTQIETLINVGLGSIQSIALDMRAGKMVWGNRNEGKIQRANMNIPPGQTPDSRTDLEDLVVGLADPVRVALDISCAAAGDGNADGIVDFADFGALQRCFTGNVGWVHPPAFAPECRCLNFNDDGDIDTFDYAAFFDTVFESVP